MLSGRMLKVDPQGRIQRAGARSVFVLPPAFEDPMEAEAQLLELDGWAAVGQEHDAVSPDGPGGERSAREIRVRD